MITNRISLCGPVKGLLALLAGGYFLVACSAPGRGLFAGKSAHEQYADKLSNAGLKTTVLGQNWFLAASKGLAQPLTVTVPYRETGYFDAARPDAAGYRFTVKRGEVVSIQLNKKPTAGFTLFLELWESVANASPRLLAAADSTAVLNYEIKKDGDYLLRLQPELLAGGEYTLEIRTRPSLEFPVAAVGRPRISSFWGDTRDAGARNHEGIDIFSPRYTPVLAVADGVVTSVTNNNLGGKVVFMRPRGRDFVVYYAHLDSQLVRSGQQVQTGDTLGLIGNTGNARNTPPHLHFGIYTSGGAIDPLPFVDTRRSEPATVALSLDDPDEYRRTSRQADVYVSPGQQGTRLFQLPAGTLLQVQAATGSWYKVQLPDGGEGFIAGGEVSPLHKPLRTYTSDSVRLLLDKPDVLGAAKAVIEKSKSLPVLGLFNNYYYVDVDSVQGWVLK